MAKISDERILHWVFFTYRSGQPLACMHRYYFIIDRHRYFTFLLGVLVYLHFVIILRYF